MSDYITLIGAEDVSRAGSRMAEAAAEMNRAASSINYALEMHQRFLDDWLSRFNATLEDRISDYRQVQS